MHHCACLPTALSCPLPETTGITQCKESALRQAYAYIVPRLPIVHAAAERVARAPATGFVAFTATTCLVWLA
nr:unnamed protein product [Spirometra erinaceieuropaei]